MKELALVRPTWDEEYRLESAARFIVFDIWVALGGTVCEPQMAAALGDAWAGGVLRRMQAHHRARQEASRRHEESQDPVKVAARREEQQRLTQEEHAARLARKLERDRAWHERQGSERS